MLNVGHNKHTHTQTTHKERGRRLRLSTFYFLTCVIVMTTDCSYQRASNQLLSLACIISQLARARTQSTSACDYLFRLCQSCFGRAELWSSCMHTTCVCVFLVFLVLFFACCCFFFFFFFCSSFFSVALSVFWFFILSLLCSLLGFLRATALVLQAREITRSLQSALVSQEEGKKTPNRRARQQQTLRMWTLRVVRLPLVVLNLFLLSAVAAAGGEEPFTVRFQVSNLDNESPSEVHDFYVEVHPEWVRAPSTTRCAFWLKHDAAFFYVLCPSTGCLTRDPLGEAARELF